MVDFLNTQFISDAEVGKTWKDFISFSSDFRAKKPRRESYVPTDEELPFMNSKKSPSDDDDESRYVLLRSSDFTD